MLRGIRAIFYRELLTRLRSPGAFIAHGLFLILLALSVYLVWPYGSAAIPIQSQISRKLFELSSTEVLLVLSLLAPIFSATAITSEREQDCLNLMIVTPIRSSTILMGKFVCAIVYLILLLISALPILSLSFLIGGVSFSEIVYAFVMIMLCILTSSLISVFCSCYLKRTFAALAISYLLVLPIIGVVTYFSVLGGVSQASLFFWCVVLGGLDILLFYFAVLGLERDNEDKPENEDEQIGLQLNRDEFPDKYLIPPVPEKGIAEGINPVFYKELYFEVLGQGTLILRLLIQLAVFVSLLATILMCTSGPIYYTGFMAVFAMMITPALASGSFTQEHERGTYDLLSLSQLSFWQIFWGKLRSITRLSFLLLGFIAFPLLVALFIEKIRVFELIAAILILFSVTLFMSTISLFISAYSKNTIYAMITTYGVFFFLFIFPLICHWLVFYSSQFFFTTLASNWGLMMIFSPFSALVNVHQKNSQFLSKIAEGLPPFSGTIYVSLLGVILVLVLVSLISFHRKKKLSMGKD